MSKHGRFSGEPRTDWLANRKAADRNMRVVDDFWFEDPDRKRWLAPAGSEVNGANIPRTLWSLLGSPYTGDYRRASVVHDVACQGNPSFTERRAADRMFYHACRAGGCGRVEATILYVGARIGALVPSVAAWRNAETRAYARSTWSPPGAAEQKLAGDCLWVWEQLLAATNSDDPAKLEQELDAILANVVGAAPLKAVRSPRRTGRSVTRAARAAHGA